MDVVVIGGGIAGVSIAAEVARGARVRLVEAEPMLARHTTGRSAAVYLPTYGPPVVRALTAASRERFPEGLLSPRPMLWLATGENVGMPDGAQEITVDEACAVCPVLRPEAITAAGRDDGMMDVDAMGLHQHYVRELKARGGVIDMSSPVTSVDRDGGGWRINAGSQEITADLVVNAAGAWVDRVAAMAGVPEIGIEPFKRTIAIAAGGPVDHRWPMVCDVDDRFYFRPEGQAMLISPADETPSEPGDAKPDDLDIALAMERVNDVTTLGLRSVRTAWAGLRSFVPGRGPVVGDSPDHPGFHFFAGQGGYGIQMAPALAAAGAAVVLGDSIPDDIPVTVDELRGR